MLDLVKLYLQAGDGGNGKVSFWRNKRVLKGGPDGGAGGAGGNIIFHCDPTLNTLQHFAGKKRFIAPSGQAGGRVRKGGAKGDDLNLAVPLGTVVWLIAENHISSTRRQQHGLKQLFRSDECPREKYYLEKETHFPPPRSPDDLIPPPRQSFFQLRAHLLEDTEGQYLPLPPGKLLKIANFSQKNEQLVLCQGGFGGRGNEAFKGPANTTPLEAEYGTFGEQKLIYLEQRLLANVGLVGFPSVGKSSLLKRLTSAHPKIADYPFTTLEPNLGVLPLSSGRSLVLADIPGLITGASQGRGLGFTFLRHIQNTSVLAFILSLDEALIHDSKLSLTDKACALRWQLESLETELRTYNPLLLQKKRLLVFNKTDLYDDALRQAIITQFQTNSKLLFVSAVTGEGLRALSLSLDQLSHS